MKNILSWWTFYILYWALDIATSLLSEYEDPLFLRSGPYRLIGTAGQYRAGGCVKWLKTHKLEEAIMDHSKMRREQWLLINEISTAVMNLHSVFCGAPDDNHPDREYSREELNILIQGIAEKCDGTTPLKDAIWTLEEALNLTNKS